MDMKKILEVIMNELNSPSIHVQDSVIMHECSCKAEPKPIPKNNDKFQRRPIIGRRCLNPIQDLTTAKPEDNNSKFKEDLRKLHELIMTDTEESKLKKSLKEPKFQEGRIQNLICLFQALQELSDSL